MTIENLIKAVPPPGAPFEAFDAPWGPIETAVGTPLPPDFKDFARLYGNGYFMEFMGIAAPRSSDRGVAYARWVGGICRDFRGLSQPYALWPDPGGLFPVGATDNGDYIFWLPEGDVTAWRVVVWDRSGLLDEEFEAFDCDLTDFLAGLATGEVTPKAFPDDLLYCDHLFQPDTE